MSTLTSTILTNRMVPTNSYMVGEVIFVPFETVPDGWMECDGSLLLIQAYPELFARIGTRFGGDGVNNFKIPDFRGEFLRVWDHGKGVDSSRTLGSFQTDAFQGHYHEQWLISDATSSTGTGTAAGRSGQSATAKMSTNDYVRNPISDGTNGAPRVAPETRPRNVALMAIIKVKNIIGTDFAIAGANADTLDGLHAKDFLMANSNASPIGTVIMSAGETTPDGWLECDGSAISRTTFSELFSRIGTTYGIGDGSTTFNLPDLRGEFVRGWDHLRGLDSDRQLGTGQLDDLKSHTHTFSQTQYAQAIMASGTSSVTRPVSGGTEITISPTGGAETRPRNIALMFIIKVKNIAGSDPTVAGANADTVDGLHSNDFMLMLAGNNTSPIGSISMVPYGTPDAGWLECDGQAVSRVTFCELFNKIGTTFGIGDGSTTFNIPDLRGEFLRGWDHGRGVDNGRTLGSEELDAFQGHSPTPNDGISYGAGRSLSVSTSGVSTGSGNWKVAGLYLGSLYNDGIHGDPRIDSETRPRNIALMFVIKAKIIAGTDPVVINNNADTLDGLHANDLRLYTDREYYLEIHDEKPSGTSGGSFTSGAWQTRVLNTIKTNEFGASLNNNQITLPAGTYICDISCPAYGVNGNVARLFNVTDNISIMLGSATFSSNGNANALAVSRITGKFTLSEQKILEVRHICQATGATNGFGVGASLGEVETYTVAIFRKVG